MEQSYSLKQRENQAKVVEQEILVKKVKELTVQNCLVNACQNLENFLNRENFPVEKDDYLYKNIELYQWEDPQIVQERVKKRLLLKSKIQELALAGTQQLRENLEKEITELNNDLAFLLGEKKSLEKQEKLAEKSRNALRTSWAKNVFAEMNLAIDEVAESGLDKVGLFENFRFIHHACVNAFRQFLQREKEAMEANLSTEKIFAEKKDFIEKEMSCLVKFFEQLSDKFLEMIKNGSQKKEEAYWDDFENDIERLQCFDKNPVNRHLAFLRDYLAEFFKSFEVSQQKLLQKKLNEVVLRLAE